MYLAEPGEVLCCENKVGTLGTSEDTGNDDCNKIKKALSESEMRSGSGQLVYTSIIVYCLLPR